MRYTLVDEATVADRPAAADERASPVRGGIADRKQV
jgi:hypothetical protein